MSGEGPFTDQWQTYVPRDSFRGRSPLFWLALGIAGACLLSLCIGGAYLATRPLLEQGQATLAPPPLPTDAPAEATETAVAAATNDVTPPVEATATSDAGAVDTAVPATATPTPTPTNTPGPTATPTPRPGTVSAERVASAPTIDGNLSEWTGSPDAASTFRVFSAASWDGSADLTANWWLAWDNQNLYIAVDITDDTHVQTQTGNQIFRGDSIDLQIDTDIAANATRVNPATYQIIISPGDFAGLGESAFRFRGTSAGQIVDAPGHSIQVAAQQQGDGYTMEAAIPWANLNVTAAPDLLLGLSLNANDNDQPGEAIQEVMMSHVSTRTLTDPTSWGALHLEP